MKGQLKTENSFSLYRTFELEVGTTSTQKLGIWTGITVELETGTASAQKRMDRTLERDSPKVELRQGEG